MRRLGRSLHQRQLPVGCVSHKFHTKSSDSSIEAIGTAAKLPDAEPTPAKHPKHTTTLKDILERRAKAGKLVAGTAAYSDSDMFKAPVGHSVMRKSGSTNHVIVHRQTKRKEMGP
jgi:aromatic amino acid aminotransferase I